VSSWLILYIPGKKYSTVDYHTCTPANTVPLGTEIDGMVDGMHYLIASKIERGVDEFVYNSSIQTLEVVYK